MVPTQRPRLNSSLKVMMMSKRGEGKQAQTNVVVRDGLLGFVLAAGKLQAPGLCFSARSSCATDQLPRLTVQRPFGASIGDFPFEEHEVRPAAGSWAVNPCRAKGDGRGEWLPGSRPANWTAVPLLGSERAIATRDRLRQGSWRLRI